MKKYKNRIQRAKKPGLSLTSAIILMLAVMAVFSACSSGSGNDMQETGSEWKYTEEVPDVPDDRRLVVYTSHKAEVYEPIIREFEERTGIWVDTVQGGTKAILERIRNEYDFGGIDIMFGGGVETLNSYKDCFDPYRAGEEDRIIEGLGSGDDLWTPFTELPIVFIYNTMILSEEEAPQSWDELFDEKWAGKISFADPFNSGTSYTILSALIQMKAGKSSVIPGNYAEERSVISAFMAQLEGNLAAGSGQVPQEVADGIRTIGITLEETALRWIADGEHIGMIYPSDGVVAVPDGCALVKNAPHRKNAEKFIDFIISRDVQRYMVENMYRRTVRSDIENPGYFREIRLTDFDTARSGEDEERILKLWREQEAE
ncbi:MAG: ABC transporter substrate-binding protein [Lachnospiraceae bacterium]|nr:ABC transporter substrate-binding protein [Lachnospiraceae bacterium]